MKPPSKTPPGKSASEKSRSPLKSPTTAVSATERRLARYLRSGRIHPTLLFAGPEREEKLAAARRLAQLVLCRELSASGACGHCSTCRRVEREIHPDVLWVREPEEETLKIDLVRDLCHQMEIGALEGGAKICIIDECQRLSSAAANAFLKTLEEPGPGRYFWLLTTQAGSLLPTILSRCLQFTFKPSAEATPLPEGWREEFQHLLDECLKTGSPFRLIAAMEAKERVLGFVQYLQTELRDALTAQGGRFASLSPFACLQLFEGALRLEGRLRSNANAALLLEGFLRETLLGAQ